MQNGVSPMKLSLMYGHHSDPHTDRLYQPLRAAIQHIDLPQHSRSPFSTQLRHSFLPSRVEQLKIKESTMFPENMRLIETNNPLKRMRARSKSYKAISFDQNFRTPLDSALFREEIKGHPARRKEIVYDYEPDSYHQEVPPSPQPPPTRVRSATLIPSLTAALPDNVQRVQSTTMAVHRKAPAPSNQVKAFPQPPCPADPQLVQARSERDVRPRGIPDFSSEYYQHCSKYTFSPKLKAKSKKELGGQGQALLSLQSRERSSRSNSNYKYNLFSMMDEQANLRCQNGFCTKNEVVAPKRKKQW